MNTTPRMHCVKSFKKKLHSKANLSIWMNALVFSKQIFLIQIQRKFKIIKWYVPGEKSNKEAQIFEDLVYEKTNAQKHEI